MLSSLISAGSNIIGGILGSNDKAKDRKLQKQFAQEGIRWKVADAKAAGIHPLAALGAQTTSYSPVSVGGPSLATGLASAGQDISRAVDATRTGGERLDAYSKTIQDLNVQRMGLENELLASQIAKVRQAGSPPPMPTPGDQRFLEGQGDSPLVKIAPFSRTAADAANPAIEGGAVPETGYGRTITGWAPVPSKDVKERIEDNLPAELGWMLRNQLAPTLGQRYNPPTVAVPPDSYWFYNPFTQEYQLRKYSKNRWLTGGFKRKDW